MNSTYTLRRSTLVVALAAFALTVACDKGTDTTTTAPPPVKDSTEKPATDSAANKAGDDKAADDKAADDKAPDNKADGKKAEGVVSEKDGKGGQIVKSELYNVKFTVPEDWKVSKSPTGISANSADGKILMVVAGSASQDLAEAALNDLKKNLKFKDVNIDKQGTTSLNGLVGLRGEGDATLINEDESEEPIHFVAFTSKVDDKAITVLLFSSKELYEQKIDLIEGVLNTMDKI